MIKLSILIPTLNNRKEQYRSLVKSFGDANPEVEVIAWPDDGQISTGEKRQQLLTEAVGKYIVFIDDDDQIHADYISDILNAIDTNPDADCIGFKVTRYLDGVKDAVEVHSIENKVWMNIGAISLRNITHICPVKRELALKAGFESKYETEDYAYAMKLAPYLTNMVFLDKELYIYNKKTKLGTPISNGVCDRCGYPVSITEWKITDYLPKYICDNCGHAEYAKGYISAQATPQADLEEKLVAALAKKDIIWNGVVDGFPTVIDEGNLVLLDALKTEYNNYLRGFVDFNLIVRRITSAINQMKRI